MRVDERTSACDDTVNGSPVEASPPGPLEAPAFARQLDRYPILGELGRGGMGEVFRVWDHELRRPVALKVVRLEAKDRPEVLARFLKEARITAQLQHPGAVPVYALGHLSDGRPYYTMEEVRGRTLKEVLEEVHGTTDPAAQRPRGDDDGSRLEQTRAFRHLIDAFHSVCETIAYAHSQNVVHRDLKPTNIMIAAFGEVLVLDWGLARRTEDRAERALEGMGGLHSFDGDPVGDALLTTVGAITGTPAYMSPEQAFGETERLTFSSDVYSLGAILYELLCGRPPYQGANAWEVLGQVRAGPPPLPRPRIVPPSVAQTLDLRTLPSMVLTPMVLTTTGDGYTAVGDGEETYAAAISAELEAICLKAMAREPSARYPHAGLLAQEVNDWLDGARRQVQALEIVADAERLLPEVAERKARATELRSQAAGLIAQLESGSPVEARAPAWALEDEAERLEREATLKEAEYVKRLHAAVMHHPGLPQACARLADFYHEQHGLAEAARDERRTAQSQELLRMYDRGRYAAYLTGDGAVSLVTEPAGAEVHLFRYELQARRLVPRFVRSLGCTPVFRETLPMGPHLLVLKSPRGGPDVRYPVFIGRQQHWDGIPPGGTEAHAIYLPAPDELGPDDVYVPAGWFQCGWDGLPGAGLPTGWQWVDGFVVRRFPITNREYISCLNDLIDRGETRTAFLMAPQTYGVSSEEPGDLLYALNEAGRFWYQSDATLEDLNSYPVTMLDWHQATAFARWTAAHEGLPWRLMLEPEWEKAARGVDARLLPWGNYPEPTWSHGFSRWQTRSSLTRVDTYPIDESPYGVRGMGGNVRDWCESLFDPATPKAPDAPTTVMGPGEASTYRVVRGGSWQSGSVQMRLVGRFCAESSLRSNDIGLRLARRLEVTG